MIMGNYIKKPVVIEAFKLGVDYIPDWFMDAVTANEVILHGTSSGFNHVADTNADIHTLEGWHHANYGDYIIRGVKGEIYPCKPDIFDMTYDAVGKQKTNADRIRAMSDEELARFIPDWSYTNACKCDEQPYVDCNNECEKCVLEWLKQPAEVE
jgi:hypothetical protein